MDKEPDLKAIEEAAGKIMEILMVLDNPKDAARTILGVHMTFISMAFASKQSALEYLDAYDKDLRRVVKTVLSLPEGSMQ